VKTTVSVSYYVKLLHFYEFIILLLQQMRELQPAALQNSLVFVGTAYIYSSKIC